MRLRLLPLLLTAGLLAACAPAKQDAVVVYTSLDEPYSKPVFEAFTRETGLKARPVYDTEANKSRGLAGAILAERSRPRADVFWSSEVMQTLRLQKEGALEPYLSPAAKGVPSQYRDPAGHWTGFAGRFRVLAYNHKRLKKPPRSLLELGRPEWNGEVAMANPLFGTTMTEAAALWQVLGPKRAQEYYRSRLANETRIVDGNSVAAEQASRGDVLVAQTDTDDAFVRMDAGAPLEVVFPDQDGIGALLIPNTAALVRGGPHTEAGRRFLDYLLRPETELLLAELPSRQLPLRPSLRDRLPEKVRPLAKVRAMKVDYARLRDDYEAVDSFLRSLFLR